MGRRSMAVGVIVESEEVVALRCSLPPPLTASTCWYSSCDDDDDDTDDTDDTNDDTNDDSPSKPEMERKSTDKWMKSA